MKTVLIIAVSLFFAQGCKESKPEAIVIEPVSDSVAKIPDNSPVVVDTLGEKTLQAFKECDSVIKAGNVLLRRNDSLKTELFLAQYKIKRVKYYLAIVSRRPSQSKFLRGWVIRAVK